MTSLYELKLKSTDELRSLRKKNLWHTATSLAVAGALYGNMMYNTIQNNSLRSELSRLQSSPDVAFVSDYSSPQVSLEQLADQDSRDSILNSTEQTRIAVENTKKNPAYMHRMERINDLSSKDNEYFPIGQLFGFLIGGLYFSYRFPEALKIRGVLQGKLNEERKKPSDVSSYGVRGSAI